MGLSLGLGWEDRRRHGYAVRYLHEPRWRCSSLSEHGALWAFGKQRAWDYDGVRQQFTATQLIKMRTGVWAQRRSRSTLQVPPHLECCQLSPGSHPWNKEVCGNAGGKPSQGPKHSCSTDCHSEATMSCLVPSLLLARTNTSATNSIEWFNHHNNLKKHCLYFLHLYTRTPRRKSWSKLQEVSPLLRSRLGLPSSELSFNLCVTWLFSPAAPSSTQRLGLQGTHH